MKTGTGHDKWCLECGIDAGALDELLHVLAGPSDFSVADKLRVGGYPQHAKLLDEAIRKLKK